jgi:hypothetical protein
MTTLSIQVKLYCIDLDSDIIVHMALKLLVETSVHNIFSRRKFSKEIVNKFPEKDSILLWVL